MTALRASGARVLTSVSAMEALLNIAAHALAEENNRQLQNLPHIGGVADRSHFPAQFQVVYTLDPGHNNLQNSQPRHNTQKWHQQFPVFPAQKPVHKEPPDSRVNQAEQIAQQGHDHGKDDGGPRALHSFPDEGQHALPLSARFKVFSRGKHQNDAGERVIKFLHGHLDPAAGRIVQHGIVSPEPVQHDKMVEVPVDNAGKSSLFFQCIRLAAETLDLHAVMLSRQHNVPGIAAVPGHAAIIPPLFQRDPAVIIGHDHRQAGGAAFQRFHLQNHRYPRSSVGNR